ncbi:MAG: type VI secretion system tip protein VgrG [Okeania sp. SIO2G4]|uniref:type VI secretion system tip protein VgrG n=1 Tax=unclassified Okeania TaxID=2634635 RepID=UPI0013B79BE8|nr:MULTISPECIES: type VI secretion system tip protein VgrG [unclassified Okeania]NEP05846.1 type VI secretion system tip protein VgrG [Okeania sp. SIO4D6]NEP40126.1 type VI secretion system tip protein VgrG [Okeania sp. SIO2H7]NEP73992.1 type VI secretion system tip protein VgrG [Okeania sp. SIO2G5]NEP92606.1 type VI secretion system tip protein VgrG [Okeania sp. SIO2F5]NEQ90065.1 type VI secretion system tip protein VgrG [Okeania sp. SIO2G4]
MSGVVTTTILSNGSRIDPEYNVMSIDIIKEVNKIPIAQITLLDGDAAKQEFPISNTDFFKPGNKVEIKLRYEGKLQKEATVFEGIIVKHSVQADRYSSLLTIDLKDAAIKLTTERKSVVFRDMTDKKIIDEIIKKGGLKVTSIAATKPTHKEIVQYYCTDWDFILSRADVNSQWVLVDDGEISLVEPNLTGAVKHTFEYGISDIYEFEMEADISHQYGTIESTAWDIKTQKNLPPKKAKNVSLSQGNLKGDELAKSIGAENYQLINSSQLDDQELQAWADGKMLKSRLSMLKGRFKIPGFADIKPGDTMEVDGIGKRFNGKTLITGIRHQVNAQGWQTDVQFGLSPNFFAQQNNNIIDRPAAGLIPAINGLQIGIVDKFESDPDKQFRVKVRVPTIEKDGVIWARLASVEAGNKRGIFFRPEPGDEVILGFINDDPRQAIILGAVHSEKNVLPIGLEVTQENYKKGIVTKEGLKIILDDENKLIEISTPNSNIFRLSDKDGGIYLEDENGNTMIMDDKGVQIKSSKDIVIEGKNITIKGSKVDVN